MTLMTGEQYIESMKKKNLQVYMFGKKIPCPADDPILRPSMNSVRMTYDLAQKPEYQELMTAISPYTGERVNRFTHIHQSTTDLMNKVKMQRLWVRKRLPASSAASAWMLSMRYSPRRTIRIKNMVRNIMKTS